MAFLAPFMLIGAVAAGIPIALHFFYRSRYRTVPWAAMKFLLTSIEQTSRRLRFQELLLLITRVVLLLLLGFALARPSTRTASGSQAEAVDAVFVIDTSMSMAAQEGQSTRLEQARSSALAVLEHLPPYSTVQIFTSSDRATLLGPQVPSNLDHARYLIQEVEGTHQATDFLPALGEAAVCLAKGNAANKELYLFSDMQKRGWDEQSSATTGKLQEISRLATIHLVRCGMRMPRNVTLVGITPQSAIPHTGERAAFSVLVRNGGTETARDLVVSLQLEDQEAEAAPIAEIHPGETRPVSLTAKLARPGLSIVTASVKEDELEPDNRFDLLLNVRDRVNVLVIDGTPNEREPEKSGSYFLVNALRPVPESFWARYHIQPQVVTAAQAAPELLETVQVCVFANVSLRPGGEGGAPSPAFLDRLTEFVRAGGSLVIFGGPNVSDGTRRSPEPYNHLLFEERRLLPCRIEGDYRTSPDQAVRLDPTSVSVLGFLAPFREEPLDAIGQVDLVQGLQLAELDAANPERDLDVPRVALRLSNGQPVVIERRIGDGRAVLVATTADRRWTDWAIRQTFLPFVHISLGHLLRGQAHRHNLTAGEQLRWQAPPSELGKPFALLRPDATQIRLGEPKFENSRAIYSTTETSRAGVFRIVADPVGLPSIADRGIPFAVTPDLREVEDLDALTDSQIDDSLGFTPIHLAAGDSNAFLGIERFQSEWTIWVLACVLLVALVEVVLAWWCGQGW